MRPVRPVEVDYKDVLQGLSFFKRLQIELEKGSMIQNSVDTPPDVILEQMNEPRPLPMGRKEFDEWSERIISGALIPGGKEDPQVFKESQVFCLANMLMHLGPTESHKPDAFFIHSLRKFAINQVADTVRKELHEAAKARTALIEAEKSEEQKAVEAVGEDTLKRAECLKTSQAPIQS